MKILDRILRAGEGKKLKALQGLVPDVNALEPELERLSDDELKAAADNFAAVQEEFEQVAADYNDHEALVGLTDAELDQLAFPVEEA